MTKRGPVAKGEPWLAWSLTRRMTSSPPEYLPMLSLAIYFLINAFGGALTALKETCSRVMNDNHISCRRRLKFPAR
jgi:hypothetical protein